MSLFKRGKTWWVDFTTPAGERIRRTARTRDRTQAQEYHDKLRAEAWRIEKLGERPSYVWDEAAYKFLIETQHKATHDEDKVKLKWLQQFLRGKPLAEINRDVIASIGERKLQETTPATANRYLALIRAILRKAANDWEWIDRAPFVRLYKEAKRRIRWITPEQAATLLEELPEHQRDVVLLPYQRDCVSPMCCVWSGHRLTWYVPWLGSIRTRPKQEGPFMCRSIRKPSPC